MDLENETPSSKKKKKKSKPTTSSIAKKFFKKGDKLWKYTLCSKTFVISKSGTTTSLNRHMESAHQDILSQAPNTIKKSIDVGGKYNRKDPRQMRLNMRLVFMVVKDVESVRMIERTGFRAFVHDLNPRYKMPCRKTFSKKLLPEAENRTQTRLKKTFEKVKHVAITSDMGSSIVNDPYNTITAHYLHPKTEKLETTTLECRYFPEKHSADNIGKDVKACLNGYGIW